MTPRHRRLAFVSLAMVGVLIAGALVVQALRSNMAYFFTPAQVLAGEAPPDTVFRIGGMVEEGSLNRIENTLDVEFVVALNQAKIPVSYTGILPDLFGEGQGVVVKGRMGANAFKAEQVLAKHDEDYVAPEIVKAMEKSPTHESASAAVQMQGSAQ